MPLLKAIQVALFHLSLMEKIAPPTKNGNIQLLPQLCSRQSQHTAQEMSGSYYSRTKPKEETRASLFHSSFHYVTKLHLAIIIYTVMCIL